MHTRLDSDMQKCAFVTGASSGIGRALAKRLVSEGYRVGVVARRLDRLESLASECAGQESILHYAVDVSDQTKMLQAIEDFTGRTQRIDLVIANAGIPDYVWHGENEPEKWTRLIEVNVNGVINTVLPFLPLMRKQGYGHLVAVGSLASLRPMPYGPYPASKVAVEYLMRGLGMDLKKHGIHCTVVMPGFVDTEALPKDQEFPFLISTEQGVDEILHAVKKKKKTYIFPRPWRLMASVLRRAPDFVIKRMLDQTHGKMKPALLRGESSEARTSREAIAEGIDE